MGLLGSLKDRMWLHETHFAFAIAGGLLLTFYFIIAFLGGDSLAMFYIPFAALGLISVSSFTLSSVLLVLALFLDTQAIALSSAVWVSLLLGVSFALNHPNFRWRDFSTPLTPAIVVYGLLILPSFLYAARPMVSVFMLFNVVAFMIVMYSFVAGLRTYSDLHRILFVYLVMVLAVAFDVIRLSISGKVRPFGFAGIWFVDYSALGVCVAITAAFFSQGKMRIMLIVFSVITTIALILTQTRNTWISGSVTLTILAVYILLHPDIVGVPRKQIATSFIVGSIILSGIVAIVLNVNPRIERRVEDISRQTSIAIDREGMPENSLVTRILIWDTALNAFRAHPVVGIGVYAFRFASHEYSTLPELLYYRYVVYRSVHQTQLAVLAETGILGFVGFTIFIVTLLRQSYKSIRLAGTLRGKQYALIGTISVVYCVVSMTFTDSWLWGQQVVLFGIVCGASFAIGRLNSAEHSSV